MSTDLRELLELASDDVPELDLAPEAWAEARTAEPRRRATHGARRGWCGRGRGAGSRAAGTQPLTEPGTERHDDGERRRGRPAADVRGGGHHGVPGARAARRGAAAALPGCRAPADPAPPGPGRPGHPRRAGPGGGSGRAAACRVPRRRGRGRLPPGALRAGRTVPGRDAHGADHPGGGPAAGAQPAVDLRRPAPGRHPAARERRRARREGRGSGHRRGARPDAVAGGLGPGPDHRRGAGTRLRVADRPEDRRAAKGPQRGEPGLGRPGPGRRRRGAPDVLGDR